MKSRQGSVLETLRRIQGFLDTADARFTSINASSLRQNIDDTVTRLTASAVDQEGGFRGSLGDLRRCSLIPECRRRRLRGWRRPPPR